MQKTDTLLMGIDVGTTAVKGAVYTVTGECVFVKSLPYPTVNLAEPGWVEQNPADWMDRVKQICAEALQSIGQEPIVALGLTSQVNTHVFVDAAGAPLMPAIVWQDLRCAASAAKLDQAISDALRAECWGSAFKPDPSFLMSRAQWLFDERPDLWQKTRWILSPKDYCLMQLTGEVAADAISSIGLVDGAGHYITKAFQLIDGLEERLPPLKPIESVVGTVASNVLPGECPAVVGIMDAWAALYGSGAAAHGDAFQVAGTSEIIGVISNDNHGADGVVTFPPFTGWYLHAGPTQMGGETANWFATFMEFERIDQVFARAQTAIDRENPLIFLPHLMGERAPLWDPMAKGAFLGLNRSHTIADLAKAVLEGVGYSARLALEQIERAAGFPVAALKLSGGGSRSDLWSQIKADIMNRPMHRLANIDTGAFGAALIAGVGVGIYADLATAGSAAVNVEKAFLPNPAKRTYYDDLYGLYQESYQSLVGVNEGFYRLSG